VRRAAIRKLNQELGIPESSLSPQDFEFLTRIHYKSPSGEGIWGEHEVDYILIVQKDVELAVNPNEVMKVKYVKNMEELKSFMNENTMFTPWFGLIAKNFLENWWSNLKSLRSVSDQHTIHNMMAEKI